MFNFYVCREFYFLNIEFKVILAWIANDLMSIKFKFQSPVIHQDPLNIRFEDTLKTHIPAELRGSLYRCKVK